jgi:hypothetical protein
VKVGALLIHILKRGVTRPLYWYYDRQARKQRAAYNAWHDHVAELKFRQEYDE